MKQELNGVGAAQSRKLANQYRYAKIAEKFVSERPNGSASKRHTRIRSKSEYGNLSTTSRYRQNKIADTTLSHTFNAALLLIEADRQLKAETAEKATKLTADDYHKLYNHSYAVPTMKGRTLT